MQRQLGSGLRGLFIALAFCGRLALVSPAPCATRSRAPRRGRGPCPALLPMGRWSVSIPSLAQARAASQVDRV